MPTRDQVRRLLDTGIGYESAARRLSLHPGLAYLIATGVPADGGDTLTEEERSAPYMISASQQLVNPPPENPTTNDEVERWMRARAAADAQMQAAARSRADASGAAKRPAAQRSKSSSRKGKPA